MRSKDRRTRMPHRATAAPQGSSLPDMVAVLRMRHVGPFVSVSCHHHTSASRAEFSFVLGTLALDSWHSCPGLFQGSIGGTLRNFVGKSLSMGEYG